MNGLFFGYANYFAVIVLMMAGLYIVYSSGNLIKRMVGLALFQTSTGLFYISLSKVAGGTAPIIVDTEAQKQALAAQLDPAYVAEHGVNGVVYSNPLPHVLILTAIVVGVATLAVGLAIVVRLREAYGTIEMDNIAALDRAERAGPERSGPERLGLGA
jgi:multicomponent Na+:H+ antiporter subunit C